MASSSGNSWKGTSPSSTTSPSFSSSEGHVGDSPQSSIVTSVPKPSSPSPNSGQLSTSPTASRQTASSIPTAGSIGESDDLEFHSASDTPKKSGDLSNTPSALHRLSWNSQQFLSRHRQKNSEMHKLFKELPASEKLLDDYSCAMQREILAHGRLYLTQSYLCFYANIFTWETLLIIPLNKIQSITKERTVFLFPNAIQVTTGSEKYTFASFIQRDTSYQVLFRLWQNSLLNFPMPLTDLYIIARKSWGDPHKFNSEADMWSACRPPTGLSQTSQSKIDGVDDTQSHLSTASPSLHTNTSDDDTRRVGKSVSSQAGEFEFTPGRIPNKLPVSAPALLEPLPAGLSTRIRSNSANFPLTPRSDSDLPRSNSISTAPARASSSFRDEVLRPISPSELNASRREVPNLATSGSSGASADVSNLGESGPLSVGARHEEAKGDLEHAGVPLGIQLRPRNTVVGDNDSQLSHPLLIIRDGTDRQSINESLLSSEFETTSIADAGEVLCGCDDHDGCLVVNDVFGVNVEVLFQLLFTDSDFMRDFLKSRNISNIEFGEWLDLAAGTRERDISYTLNLNYSFGPKYSPTTERQVYSKLGQPGLRHIVELEVTNSNIPHGDKFFTKVKVCMTRVTHNQTRLRVTSTIAFRKSCWSVVKTLIERNAGDGIRNHYAKLEANLKEYIPGMSDRRKTPKPSTRGYKRKRGRKSSLGSKKELDLSVGSAFGKTNHSRNASDVSGNALLVSTVQGDPGRPILPQLRSSQSNLVSGATEAKSATIGASLTSKTSLWLLVLVALLVICNMGLYYLLMGYQPRHLARPSVYPHRDTLPHPTIESWPDSQEGWLELLERMENSHSEKLKLYEAALTEVLNAVREVEIRMGQLFGFTARILKDQLANNGGHFPSGKKSFQQKEGTPVSKQDKEGEEDKETEEKEKEETIFDIKDATGKQAKQEL